MKAAVSAGYHPPEVVRIAEVEKPTAGDNEVLVKVHATTVNRTDCGVRAGKPFILRFFTGPRQATRETAGLSQLECGPRFRCRPSADASQPMRSAEPRLAS